MRWRKREGEWSVVALWGDSPRTVQPEAVFASPMANCALVGVVPEEVRLKSDSTVVGFLFHGEVDPPNLDLVRIKHTVYVPNTGCNIFPGSARPLRKNRAMVGDSQLTTIVVSAA